jgi:2-polyprenyl-3-methyl-5-hydroxy-6-metoxy-1,4-benzoquinol methylase
MGKKCFVCKNSKFDYLLKKEGFDLWSCEVCGLNLVYPQPTEKELQKTYSLEGGYSHSSKGFDQDKVLYGKNPRIEFLAKNKKKKILDVGCASGLFVYACKLAKLSPVGIDLDKDSIRFGQNKGLDLRQGRLVDFKFKANSFDAINLGDIIEHVKDPIGLLLECVRILKKGGVLIVSTPNTNSLFPKMTRWIYKKFGIMWSHPTPPYHLCDFSDENLIKLLEKNSLEIRKISYSKIPLMYSIYHTGYFDELRKNMEGHSKKDIFKGLLKSLKWKIFKQLFIVFIYGVIFCIDRFFEKKGDQMVVYTIKK